MWHVKKRGTECATNDQCKFGLPTTSHPVEYVDPLSGSIAGAYFELEGHPVPQV